MARWYASVLAADSPIMSFRQASWHSWMISTAYFFDLASPLKAKTFYSTVNPAFTNGFPTYLRLAIRDLVDPKPLVRRPDQPRQTPLHILNIIQPWRERVVHVHHQDLPIRLPLVEERHDTEHFDLLDLTDVAERFADLAYVERVVVSVRTGLGVFDLGIFPGLREGAVVPNVSWMPSAISRIPCRLLREFERTHRDGGSNYERIEACPS